MEGGLGAEEGGRTMCFTHMSSNMVFRGFGEEGEEEHVLYACERQHGLQRIWRTTGEEGYRVQAWGCGRGEGELGRRG